MGSTGSKIVIIATIFNSMVKGFYPATGEMILRLVDSIPIREMQQTVHDSSHKIIKSTYFIDFLGIFKKCLYICLCIIYG